MKAVLTSNRFLLAGLAVLVFLTLLVVAIRPLTPGLKGRYYQNTEWAGAPVLTMTGRSFKLPPIRRRLADLSTDYSIEWTGVILISTPGTYTFTTASDDGSELFIGERRVVDNRGMHGLQERTGTLELDQGFHPITIRYMQGVGAAAFRTSWTPPGGSRERLSRAPLFLKASQHASSIILYQVCQLLRTVLVVLWGIWLVSAAFGPLYRQLSKKSDWWHIQPLTLKLLVYVLLVGVGLNLGLAAFGYHTTLFYTRYFFSFPTHDEDDSWKHMYNALHYFDNPNEQPRYTTLFFEQHVKFIYPPTSLLIFKPFKEVPLDTVIRVANFLSWLMILASAVIIAQIFSRALNKYTRTARRVHWAEHLVRIVVALCFTLTFYPIVRSFRLGQIQTWLYFFFVLAFWIWLLGRKGLSGVLVGCICIIKPQLGLLAAWGMLRKEWRFAGGILITSGIAGILSLWVFGLQNHLDYLQVLSYLSKHGESFHPNHSVNGLLNRLLFNGTNLTWDAMYYPPFNIWVYAGTLLSSLLLIAAALFWKFKHHAHAEVLDLSIASLSFTMASPLAWEHHYAFLLPIFVYALPATLASSLRQGGMRVLAVSYLLCANYYQITNQLAATRFNVVQSYILFGAVCVLAYLYRLRNFQAGGLKGQQPGKAVLTPYEQSTP
jgi:alpha-1,2-mannosyltransferase